MKVKVIVMSKSLGPHGLYSPWNSPGHNTGVGSLSLLQEIEPVSPALQADSLPTELSGKPLSQGSSQKSLEPSGKQSSPHEENLNMQPRSIFY